MTETLSSPTDFPDGDGGIANDMACVRCGYNLRSLRLDGPCPECGTPIERSLRGNLLRYCDPAWVGQLAQGMRWLVRGVNCVLGFVILLFVFGVVLAVITSSGPVLSAVATIPMYVAMGVLAFGWVAGLAGYWRLTAPNSARLDEEQDQTPRLAGRWGLVAAVALAILAHSIGRFFRIAATVLFLSAEAALIVGCAGLLTYIARLSLRIPDADIGQEARSVRRGLVGVLAIHLGLTILMRVAAITMPGVLPMTGTPVTPGTGAMTAAGLVGCLNPIVGLVLLSSLSRTLRLLMKYRKLLQQALEQAKRNWAARDVSA